MATNSELDKYTAEANDLADRVEELTRFHKQIDEFAALEVALTLERKALSVEILEFAGNPDHLSVRLDKLERSLKLNGASREALAEKIDAREKYLHGRLPLSLKAFATLREYVMGAVLENCRTKVRALLAAGYVIGDEHVDAVAIAMPPYVEVSVLRLPSAGWAIERPLDQKPVYWSSMTRPYTEAELAEIRAGTVKAILEAANALCGAARGLLEAARPYGDVPKFVCEPEVETPAQPDPEHLKWLEPLGGSDLEFAQSVCQQAGKDYATLPADQKEIVDRMVAERRKHPISHGVVTGEMVGDTFVAP